MGSPLSSHLKEIFMGHINKLYLCPILNLSVAVNFSVDIE